MVGRERTVAFVTCSEADVSVFVREHFSRGYSLLFRPGCRSIVPVVVQLVLLSSCARTDNIIGVGEEVGLLAQRIYHDPYAEVLWETDLRLKAQHHDHITSDGVIRAYDRAGYNVLALMSYSGVQEPFSWQERHWPLDLWVSRATQDGLSNISLFFPSGEEVGFDHLTSPFLEQYIARWESGSPEPLQYRTTQEGIDLINRNGGMAFLAHPWDDFSRYNDLRDVRGVEIYSAFAEFRRREGKESFFLAEDRLAVMVRAWDLLLDKDQTVRGIAVNDHFGPQNSNPAVDNATRDSGKILVLTRNVTIDDYRSALERGAFFAIRDLGFPKDNYPVVRSITATENEIAIDTDGEVRWVAGGDPVGVGQVLQLATLRRRVRYVRASIHDLTGSVVYTQAFVVRPVGDVNGDEIVDEVDRKLCETIQGSESRHKDIEAACVSVRNQLAA